MLFLFLLSCRISFSSLSFRNSEMGNPLSCRGACPFARALSLAACFVHSFMTLYTQGVGGMYMHLSSPSPRRFVSISIASPCPKVTAPLSCPASRRCLVYASICCVWHVHACKSSAPTYPSLANARERERKEAATPSNPDATPKPFSNQPTKRKSKLTPTKRN